MSPFQLPKKLKNLPEAALKFINSLIFIKSASTETIRSYELDLVQAFALPRHVLTKCNAGVGKIISTEGPPPHLPCLELLEVCRAALTRWSSLAPASRNRKAATLKSFLGWLYEEGAIERDLALQIHAPKVPHRLPHHISVDEALALLRYLETQNNISALLVVLLLYGAGLRVSEVCNLKWSQVAADGRTLRVVGKGGKERITALPPKGAKVLLEVRAQNKHSELVFGNAGAGGLTTRKAYDIVRDSGARAGLLQALHPHALRHSFATHLLSSGANLRTLQELLGHSTLQATQRYTHLGIDQLARTLEDFHPLSDASSKKNRRT